MIDNLFWLLNYIRTNLLESFIIPQLGISYWDFCIYLAVAAIVITVLINAVNVGGLSSFSTRDLNAREERYRNVLRERERVKADERELIKGKNNPSYGATNLDLFEDMLNKKD